MSNRSPVNFAQKNSTIPERIKRICGKSFILQTDELDIMFLFSIELKIEFIQTNDRINVLFVVNHLHK